MVKRKNIFRGHPIRFNQLTVFEDIVAKHKSVRFDVECVGNGFTWQRQSSSVDIDEDTLDDQMRERIASGAQSLRQDAFVKANVLFLFAPTPLPTVHTRARLATHTSKPKCFRALTRTGRAASTPSRHTSSRRGCAETVYFRCNPFSEGARDMLSGSWT